MQETERKGMKKGKAFKEYSGRFFRMPVMWLYRILPFSWKKKTVSGIKRRMEYQYSESEEQLALRAEEFFLQELMLALWGMAALLMILAGLLVFRCQNKGDIAFERNGFGEGKKEVSLILRRGKEKRKYGLELEEQELSASQETALKRKFFRELESVIRGDNPSLKEVRSKLVFNNTLAGWPFAIDYEPENGSYILLDGTLGDMEKEWKGKDSITTGIHVTAAYAGYTWKKKLYVRICSRKRKKQESPFAKAVQALKASEKKTREKKQYVISAREGEVRIEDGEEYSVVELLAPGAGIWLLILVHRVMGLREGERNCRQETLKDFPVIVHLLTLYMGAGLSFASSVHRISADYRGRADGNRRYAFEELLRMDRQLKLGMAQQEACMQWGKRFQEPVYQKMSMTMLQVLSKGTREGRMLLEQMEQEAFRQRMAQAQKEGEEASTRLLFPMMVLLCLVMMVVMFPAMLRFQSF